MTDSVLEELRAEMEARYSGTRTELVELGRVKDFLLALDEPAEIGAGDTVPALFLLTFSRTRRPQPARGTAVKAGDECEFLAPVRVGDTLTVTTSLVDIQVKEGKRGRKYLVTAQMTFVNQHNEKVGVGRIKTFRWGQ